MIPMWNAIVSNGMMSLTLHVTDPLSRNDYEPMKHPAVIRNKGSSESRVQVITPSDIFRRSKNELNINQSRSVI